jgi:UDP-3-O-[3-hydroxymyristoyl] glucosamine N-acyltransferase
MAVKAMPIRASFGKIEEATEGQLTFFANAKYEDFLYSTNASIVIISEAYELRKPIKATLIRVSDAYAFATLLIKISGNSAKC